MKRGLLLISALLAACSSAPENSNALYVLPEASSVTINDSVIAQRPQLVVRPVVLASYLADSGIVYRTSENPNHSGKNTISGRTVFLNKSLNV